LRFFASVSLVRAMVSPDPRWAFWENLTLS